MTAPVMRLWRVAGILFLIGAEALLYGYSYPFFSLALAERGLANGLIGLNASLAGIGILFFGPFLPRAIQALGIGRLIALFLFIPALAFGAILAFDQILAIDHVIVWFVARFVMGTCFSGLWTTTEIWLNGEVDDQSRGRIIAGSGTLYAVCQFIGPLVLGLTGAAGALPLIVAIVPLLIGAAVAASIRPSAPAHVEAGESEPGGLEPDGLGPDGSRLGGLRLAWTLGGTLMLVAFMCGIGETAMQSLLPLYGLAHGLTDAAASRLVATFSLGEAVLVLGLGWLADRTGRRPVLIGATLIASVSTAALPFVMGEPFLLQPVLFFAGGTIAGVYTLSIVLIGQDFRDRELAIVSTGFGMAYSAGSVIGATPIGALIDGFGAEALPAAVAAGFVGLTAFLARPGGE